MCKNSDLFHLQRNVCFFDFVFFSLLITSLFISCRSWAEAGGVILNKSIIAYYLNFVINQSITLFATAKSSSPEAPENVDKRYPESIFLMVPPT